MATASAESAVDSLASALVEANDQLLALYELATINAQSLDARSSVAGILGLASRLIGADWMQFQSEDATIDHGSRPADEGANPPADAQPGGIGTQTASRSVRIEVDHPSGRHAVLLAHRGSQPFGTADYKLLTAVAATALGAVHTAALHEAALAQAVVARDHKTASSLAVQALPRWRPELPGLAFFARSDPARAAGGDLFTFAVVDNVLHFVVGDVSGKGLPAAMMMTNVISAASAAFHGNGCPGPVEILETIDAWLNDYLSEAGLFVTLVAGSYEPSSGRLRVANAGHSPVVFFAQGVPHSIEASVPPIGVMPLADSGLKIEEWSAVANPGDRLMVASDGFTEQRNREGEMYGLAAMLELLRESAKTADELGDELFKAIEAHARGMEQEDDRTLAILAVVDTDER